MSFNPYLPKKPIGFSKNLHDKKRNLWIIYYLCTVKPEKTSVMTEQVDNHEEQVQWETTEDITNKKCPNCGATITFDPASGMLHCDYCGYSHTLPKPDSEASIVELDFAAEANKESFDWGQEKKSVECKQCGAVTVYDALETAAVCPFCGSTSVMPAANDKSVKPGAVVPFSVTKETAGENFTKWLKKKWFAPRKAKKNASPDAFKGIYLPYWTYDAQTTSSFTARAGYDRKVKNKDGNYETVTDWHPVSGVYQEFIDDETVMASKQQEDSGVRECEPFRLSKLVPYTPQALAGFAAERYSVGLQEGWEKAQVSINTKLKSNIEKYVKSKWRCDRVSSVKFSTLYNDITYKYVLLPAWVSAFKYKEKVYQFAVNGQTGKVGGKAPVSALRVIFAIALGIGAIVGLYYLLK